ncbi:amino acid adenylation domain-containing protein [Xanthomonas sp. A2111]|nr:non-ribosomal peptide synthetase [Xanthomonas sp. A2111]MBO9830638.1 amino acid adenylation domain-containing protein [Xanthomonas sp. A2111]
MLQNTGEAAVQIEGLQVQPVPVGKSSSKFDLRMALVEQRGNDGSAAGIAAELEFNRDLFDVPTIRALACRFAGLLREVTRTPDARPSMVCLLDDTELDSIQRSWSETSQAYTPMTLPALFELQVARTPDALAVIHGSRHLTYAQLNRRANRVAHALIHAGIGSEQMVALSLQRSPELVVALLGILKAGAVYLPIDPSYPAARIAATLEDARPFCAIVDAASRGALLAHYAALESTALWTLPALEDRADLNDNERNPDDADRVRPLDVGNAAYVLYTSGSTGKPKGVCVQHRSVSAYLRFLTKNYGIGPGDIALNLTSISFDPSIRDLLCPLASGAAVAMIDGEIAQDPVGCLRAMHATAATCMLSVTPSMLHGIVEAQATLALPLVLRQLHTCGEALSSGLLSSAISALDCEVIANQYGPTECTMTSTWKVFRNDECRNGAITIGRPVANTRLYVLDGGLQPVPPGVHGELYIGGYGLARGYFKRAVATAERFVADPFVVGQRMYRTGDLVRRLPNGDLDLLGRVDQQVKIRGVRVEPAETEAALARLPNVARAAVIAHENKSGDKQLVAYVVAEPGATLDGGALHRALAAILPGALVPAAVMVLPRLPLLPNGKLDRKELPAPDYKRQQPCAPRTSQEAALAEIFAEVLEVADIGVDDSFFELGGHSLLAMRLVARVRLAFGVELAIRDVFERPTISALALRLDCASRVRARIVAGSRPQHLPLSYSQQRLWFIHHLEGISGTYNMPLALRLHGELDRKALRQALNDVLSRHEILRTVYSEFEGLAEQRVLPAAEFAVGIDEVMVDVSRLTTTLSSLASQGFDLAKELPLRAYLLRIAADENVLLLVLHHIASDGWSLAPLIHDIDHAYSARCGNASPDWAPLPVQYADYALWQRELYGNEGEERSEIERQAEFWRTTLAGLPTIALPTDHPRPIMPSYRGGTARIVVESQLHERLNQIALENNATLFMVLHAAFALLLHKLGAGDDIVIGTPIAGRSDAALEGLVGCFLNTLVLRTDLSGHPGFAELIQRVRATDIAAYAHQDLPFEKLVETLNPTRSLSHQPLFQVMFTLQNNRMPEAKIGDLQITTVHFDKRLAKFDLRLSMADQYDANGAPAGILGEIEYSLDLFTAETASAIATRLQRLLASFAMTTAEQSIINISVMDAEELQQLCKWNNTTHPVETTTLPALFERQAARAPDAAALVFEGSTLNYATLNAHANRLAHCMIANGIGPENIVGIALPRSTDLVVALLATLKTGAAYLPLDLDYPAERIAHMVSHAAPSCVLTRSDVAACLPMDCGIPLWHFDVELAEFGSQNELNPTDADRINPLLGAHPAYVIYTSGSTGRPKGVVICHEAIVNRLQWMQATYPIGSNDRVLQKTPSSFDVSVWEFFWPLLEGATLVLARPSGHKDPSYLASLIQSQSVTTLHFVPSMLQAFVQEPTAAECTSLRRVFCSGESLSRDTQRAMQKLQSVELHNLYGPTEAAVDVSYYACSMVQDHVSVPIGKPIWNTRLYVLNAELQPVPSNVPGELYIGGVALARGYLGSPAFTAERFVANPFAIGERMYRTGDLARRLPDGNIDFLGRVDHQVKIRGLRIELGEVESRLAEQDGVAQAAVVARADDQGTSRILGYVVGHPNAHIEPKRLRGALADVLPDYMVPAAISVLPALPITPNGKLDRKALPVPSLGVRSGRPPQTAREMLLADLFAEVLGVRDISADDSFFDLGGDSIRSIQLVNLARNVCLALTPRDVLMLQNVAALAAAARPLTTQKEKDDGSGSFLPTPIMRDLFLRGGRDARSYQNFLIRSPANLTLQTLEAIIQALLDGHDVLRMRVPHNDAFCAEVEVSPRGTIKAAERIQRCSLEGMEMEQREMLLRQELLRAQKRIDPKNASQFQIVWFDEGYGRPGMLLLCFHHLVMDPVSWRILQADLPVLHAHVIKGVTPSLDSGTSFRRWSQYLHGAADSPEVQAELPYWKHVLAAPDPLLGKRPLRRRRIDGDCASHHLDLTLSPKPTASLLSLANVCAISINEFLITAFALTLLQWRLERGGETFSEVRFDMEGHGREYGNDLDLTRTVGWFTSIYPVRIDLGSKEPRIGDTASRVEILKRVSAQLRCIPRKGWAYPLLRHLSSYASDALDSCETSQVIFNYLGRMALSESRDWMSMPESSMLGHRDADLALPYTLQLMAILHDGEDESLITTRMVASADLLSEDDLSILGAIWTRTLLSFAECNADIEIDCSEVKQNNATNRARDQSGLQPNALTID